MKIRNDYVSNSSSSSFIVISSDLTKTNDITNNIKKTYGGKTLRIPSYDAKHEFGWENETTSDFLGKLNFVGLQLTYLLVSKLENHSLGNELFEKHYNLVRSVCKKYFDIDFRLNDDIIKIKHYFEADGSIEYYYSHSYDFYIDHQSCITEYRCDEMFESETSLYKFLASSESYIEGGNDNE